MRSKNPGVGPANVTRSSCPLPARSRSCWRPLPRGGQRGLDGDRFLRAEAPFAHISAYRTRCSPARSGCRRRLRHPDRPTGTFAPSKPTAGFRGCWHPPRGCPSCIVGLAVLELKRRQGTPDVGDVFARSVAPVVSRDEARLGNGANERSKVGCCPDERARPRSCGLRIIDIEIAYSNPVDTHQVRLVAQFIEVMKHQHAAATAIGAHLESGAVRSRMHRLEHSIIVPGVTP